MMKNNKYDYLIVIVIASLSLGMFFQLIKYIGLVSIPYTLCHISKTEKYIFRYFLLMIVYFILIIPFSYNYIVSGDELLNFISLGGSFLFLIQLSKKAYDSSKSIIIGWTFAFLLTLPYAFFEYVTGLHHYTSLLEENLINNKRYVSVFFGNMNRYSLFLCCCCPFIVSRLLEDNTKNKYFNFIVFILLSFFIINNASRGAILVLSITLILLIVKIRHILNYKYILLFILAFLFTYEYFSDALLQFHERLEVKGGFNDSSRSNIYIACFFIFIDYLGMGVGLGNIPFLFEKYSSLVGHIRIPHNLFLEILLISGLPFFVIFIKWLVGIYKKGYNIKDVHIRFLFVISVFTLFPLSVINSNYVLNPIMWIYFASLYVIVFNHESKRLSR